MQEQAWETVNSVRCFRMNSLQHIAVCEKQQGQIMRHASRYVSIALFAWAVSIVATAAIVLAQPQSDKGNYAIVKSGAHLLSTKRNGEGAFERIAYLPVGTIVNVSNEKTNITVDDFGEPFTKVTSQSGAHGYLQDDLYEDIGDRQLAVLVEPLQLPLFARPYELKDIKNIIKAFSKKYKKEKESEICESQKCILFSRSDGAYLNIVNDKKYEHYYAVELVKPKDGKDSKIWYLYRNYVKLQYVKLVNHDIAALSMMTWTSKEKFQTTVHPELIGKILASMKKRFRTTLSQEKIWCDLKIGANGQVGLKTFFMEAGVSAQFMTKDAGKFEQAGRFAWKKGDERIDYHLNREIKCDESEPYILNKVEIVSDKDENLFKVNIDMFRDKSCHWDKRKVNKCENWIFFKSRTDDFGNMVIVGDWNTYYAVRRIIEDALGKIASDHISSNSSPEKDKEYMLRRIEKENLYDFIIRQIAVFKKDKRIPEK